ncbi:MAG: hypothetical protein GY711_06530 [bacterium]|nr:hypothetical protein [bacterium]
MHNGAFGFGVDVDGDRMIVGEASGLSPGGQDGVAYVTNADQDVGSEDEPSLVSRGTGFIPFAGGSDGHFCLGFVYGRFVAQAGNSGSTGVLSIPIDLTALPTTPISTVLPGETWNFQAWFRDAGGSSNFTNRLSIGFQ